MDYNVMLHKRQGKWNKGDTAYELVRWLREHNGDERQSMLILSSEDWALIELNYPKREENNER